MTAMMRGPITAENFKGQFSGHETFPLRHLWLRKAYDAVKSGAHRTIFSGPESIVTFGVGKNMALAIRYWALACGIIEERDTLVEPTDLGRSLFGGERPWDERRLRALQKHLNAVRLLIVDELGYVPFTAVGAELFFEVLSQRYERGATLITSNLPFDEWTSVFGSERLTGALLDRLTHHVHILEMNGESFRLATSKKAQRRSALALNGSAKQSAEGRQDIKI